MKISMRFVIGISVALFAATLFAVAWPAWPGSVTTYGLFTAVFTALLVVGVTQRLSTGYLLLAVVLWIGFWLKLSVHLVDKTSRWVEPTGRFDFSPAAWDNVVVVSTVGALAVLCVGLIWRGRGRADGHRGLTETSGWYTRRVRAIAWATVLLALGLVVVSNEMFHIFHAGLRPAVELTWPLQGIFGWLVSVGIVLGVMVLFHLDVISGRPLWLATALFLIASTALSISTCSRGTFVLQSLPLLTTLVLLRTHIPWLTGRRLLAIVGMFVCGMLLTVAASQQRRADTLPGYTAMVETPATATPANKIVRYNLLQDFPYLMRRLSIDRWIGLEGVMAVSAYPGKSNDLLIRATRERRDKDHVDFYTGQVSQSGSYDTSRYHFATPPGMFAFLYYSGSLLVVFIGAAFLTAMVFAVERVIRLITRNPFLAGQVGFYAAILVIQMGAGGLVQPASAWAFTVAIAFVLGAFIRRLTTHPHGPR